MKAIVLAGGKSTRLRPLTWELPKPMVPVLNVPVMDSILSLLCHHNIVDVCTTLMFMPQKMITRYGNGYDYGLNLTWNTEEHALGTAGSVKATGNFVDSTVVVISGDCITDFDLTEAYRFHKKHHAEATILMTRVDVPIDFGLLVTDSAGAITGFQEKPDWNEVFTNQVNSGIYILEPSVLSMIPPDQAFDFSRDLFPEMLRQRRRLFGYEAPGYWSDIGSLDSYMKTHFDILQNKMHFHFPGKEISPGVFVDDGTEIDASAMIHAPCVIGKSCHIGPGVVLDGNVILGNNVVLEEEVMLSRSILWNGCYMDYAAEGRGCVLGNRVHIMHHVLISENVVIGDETVIREYASVKANVLIWPRKVVDPHVSVDASMVFTERRSATRFGKNGLSGVINVDFTPEFASRLGAAYGTKLGEKGLVAVFWDGSPPSRLFRYAFIAGLLSTGVKVYDMKAMFLPVVRQTVSLLDVDGAIHIMVSGDTTERLQVLLLTPNGANVDKDFEHSVESIYAKEDFIHVPAGMIADVEGMPDVHDSYLRHLMNLCNQVLIRKAKLRIILTASSKDLIDYLHKLFSGLGCHIVDAYVTDRFTPYLLLQEDGLQDALLCVWMDKNAETLSLMDKSGQVVYGDLYNVLTASILYQKNPGIQLLVPASSPSVIENLAKKHGGHCTRVRNDEQAIVRMLMKDDVFSTAYNQYQLQFDAIASLLFILEFLVQHNTTLSETLQNLPKWHLETRTLHCPWELIGHLMHRLLVEPHEGTLDTTDGIKYIFENGWILIFPDAEQPMLHFIAEGTTPRIAITLLRKYTTLIQWMMDETVGTS